MNRKQLQAWLDQFPEDTEIRVQMQDLPGCYMPWGECHEVEFEGSSTELGQEQFEYTDFNGNQFVQEDHPCFGKRVLVLGQGE